MKDSKITCMNKYIRTENLQHGYAHYTCDVHVRKDIPIKLTMQEIAEYVDGGNFCFGGEITRSGETETEHKYRVKVYTD